MSKKTAEQIARKYQQNMSQAGTAYAEGVANPSRPWEQTTINAAGAYRQGVTDALNEGRFEKGVRGKGEKWTRNTQQFGTTNYTSSAQKAAQAYSEQAAKIIQITSEVAARVHALPGDTQEQRYQKMVENARGIKEAWSR